MYLCIPTPCLNAFWHAVPTSLHILNVFITLDIVCMHMGDVGRKHEVVVGGINGAGGRTSRPRQYSVAGSKKLARNWVHS